MTADNIFINFQKENGAKGIRLFYIQYNDIIYYYIYPVQIKSFFFSAFFIANFLSE